MENANMVQIEGTPILPCTTTTTVATIESASATFFRSGWRPAMGWICVAAIAYQFLVRAILPWTLTVIGIPAVPPMVELDMGSLLTILGGTLGLGGLRTFEKVKGLS